MGTPTSRPKQQVDTAEIKRRYDLREVMLADLGRQPARRTREYWVWRCPLHEGDNTASFTVYEDHYYCYGCAADGDLFDWKMQRSRMSFEEVLAKLNPRSSDSTTS